MAASSLLPPVKSVVVYRNGDPFHTGRRFVVNHRHVGTMEAFLNEVTHSIGATLAIRTLYTPRQGHRVADLQDLQTGAQYVAAGFERFKKLEPGSFFEEGDRSLCGCVGRSLLDSLSLYAHTVFRNGDLLHPPLRFIIPRSMQQDLDQVLRLVSEKVDLRTGAVRRLCSVGGQSVSSAADLQTGQCYVAVGTERFKKLPYVELLVSKTTQRYWCLWSLQITSKGTRDTAHGRLCVFHSDISLDGGGRGDEQGLSWLKRLCTMEWRSGTVPLDWQTGVVGPLFKKGDWRMCSNYRGHTPPQESLLQGTGTLFRRNNAVFLLVMEHWTSSRPSIEGSKVHGSLPNQSTCVLWTWRRHLTVSLMASCGGCFRNTESGALVKGRPVSV
uniref:Doublecortin domain containing 2B n=1 Tax=Salarias fasciatus TaxID=181472 RepID=A0A672HEW3_SALFA